MKNYIKERFKHHWDENIKPAFLMILVGALVLVGMRLAEAAWPRVSPKLLICLASDVGDVQACDQFKR